MKNKILLGLICGLLIVGITTGCGNSKNNDDVDTNNPNENKEQVKDNTNNNTDSSLLTGTYNVPMQKIYIDVPNYQAISSGLSRLYVVGRKLNIAITPNWNKTGSTLEQAHKDSFDAYVINLENYAKIDELKIENDKNVTINGINAYRFEGKLKCHGETGDYELYTIGYSFIMDGIPCSIEGTVLDKSQDKDMINEVRNTVDAMMKTVRSEK